MKAIMLGIALGIATAHAECPLPVGKSTYSCLIQNQVTKVEVNVEVRGEVTTLRVNDRTFVADGNIHESTAAAFPNAMTSYRAWCVDQKVFFAGQSKAGEAETRMDASWVVEAGGRLSVTAQMEIKSPTSNRTAEFNYRCERVSQ